jgi:hypothetical protein
MEFEKGKAKPLTKEEKVTLGLGIAVNKHPEWSDCKVWVRSLSIDSISALPSGEGKERVTAKGECVLGFKHLERDSILVPKIVRFEVQVVDSKDSWGLPDVKVESFKLEVLRLASI